MVKRVNFMFFNHNLNKRKKKKSAIKPWTDMGEI